MQNTTRFVKAQEGKAAKSQRPLYCAARYQGKPQIRQNCRVCGLSVFRFAVLISFKKRFQHRTSTCSTPYRRNSARASRPIRSPDTAMGIAATAPPVWSPAGQAVPPARSIPAPHGPAEASAAAHKRHRLFQKHGGSVQYPRHDSPASASAPESPDRRIHILRHSPADGLPAVRRSYRMAP